MQTYNSISFILLNGGPTKEEYHVLYFPVIAGTNLCLYVEELHFQESNIFRLGHPCWIGRDQTLKTPAGQQIEGALAVQLAP